MDSAQIKKLQDYAAYLSQQAESKEAAGNTSDAVKDYVKLVDVLLVLANEAKDHPTWQQLISKAESYQKKARSMADLEGAPRSQGKAANASYTFKDIPKTPPPAIAAQTEASASSSSSVFKPFRKFPSLIGRKNETDKLESSSLTAPPPKVISSWSRELGSQQAIASPTSRPALPSSASSSLGSTQVSTLQTAEETVPYSVYSKLLEERSKLQKENEALRIREKEYLDEFKSREDQFNQAISEMVPKAQFDEVYSKLENSVSRTEYEHALAFSSIPKEKYVELQARVVDLELRLENSVPQMILDEIADIVSLLVSTALEDVKGRDDSDEFASVKNKPSFSN